MFLALASFLFLVTTVSASNLIDDIWMRTEQGKWILSIGLIIISLFSVLLAFRFLRLQFNRWIMPLIVSFETVMFILVRFLPWREGLGLLALFVAVSYFSVRYREYVRVEKKRVIR